MQDHPAPPDPDHADLREALQRDAARVPETPFQVSLHYDTMRRVRALAERPAGHGMKHAWLWATPAAALLMLALLIAYSHRPHEPLQTHTTPATEQPALQLKGSEWSYQIAAAQGDEVLNAALDRDAQQFLPPTSPLFNVPSLN